MRVAGGALFAGGAAPRARLSSAAANAASEGGWQDKAPLRAPHNSSAAGNGPTASGWRSIAAPCAPPPSGAASGGSAASWGRSVAAPPPPPPMFDGSSVYAAAPPAATATGGGECCRPSPSAQAVVPSQRTALPQTSAAHGWQPQLGVQQSAAAAFAAGSLAAEGTLQPLAVRGWQPQWGAHQLAPLPLEHSNPENVSGGACSSSGGSSSGCGGSGRRGVGSSVHCGGPRAVAGSFTAGINTAKTTAASFRSSTGGGGGWDEWLDVPSAQAAGLGGEDDDCNFVTCLD